MKKCSKEIEQKHADLRMPSFEDSDNLPANMKTFPGIYLPAFASNQQYAVPAKEIFCPQAPRAMAQPEITMKKYRERNEK